MIFHFILNPKSGRSRKKKNIEALIKKACRKRKVNYHIYYTTCPGDASEYVKSMVRISQDKQRFICLGGDGTLSEIVNSAPENPNVEFGVIPSGSGNDFIRNFTNNRRFESINAQLDGNVLSLDLLKVNNYYAINMVNIGFDCLAAKVADKYKKIPFISPSFSYAIGVMLTLTNKLGVKMKHIKDNGEQMEGEYTLTTIANGKYCGGGYMSNPTASLYDGMMDICVIKKVSRPTFISLVSCYKKGKHLEKKRAKKVIHYTQEKHYKMEFDNPIPICVDGEIKGAKSIDFSVVPCGFNFVVPKGSEIKYMKR